MDQTWRGRRCLQSVAGTVQTLSVCPQELAKPHWVSAVLCLRQMTQCILHFPQADDSMCRNVRVASLLNHLYPEFTQGGNVWEKAGVNVSVVYGSMPPEAYRAATGTNKSLGKENGASDRVPFFACGISSVMHPHNPFAPTMHFNYRSVLLFESCASCLCSCRYARSALLVSACLLDAHAEVGVSICMAPPKRIAMLVAD